MKDVTAPTEITITPADHTRRIFIRLPGDSGDYFQIELKPDHSLEIRGHDGVLAVRPIVSNQVNISLEKFF